MAKPKQAVAVAVFDAEGRMLWGQRKDSGKYTTVAGGMEDGETPEQTACRELKEEADIDAEPEALEFCGEQTNDDGTVVHVFRLADVDCEPDCKNDPDDEFVEGSLRFVDMRHGLPAKIASNLHIPAAKNAVLKLVQVDSLKKAEKKSSEPNLVITHNITEAGFHNADKLGGLPAPSIAIAHKDHPLDAFGEITLVADKSLVDPKAKVPVFDADVYSPRHPATKFKLNDKAVSKFGAELKNHANAVGLKSSDYYAAEDLEERGIFADQDHRYTPALKAMFLHSKGIPVEPKTEPAPIRFGWTSHPALQSLKGTKAMSDNWSFGDEDHQKYTQALKTAILAHDFGNEETDRQDTLEDHIDPETGLASYRHSRQVKADVENHGKTVPSIIQESEIDTKLAPYAHEYKQWLEHKKNELVGDRYIPKRVDTANGPKVRKLPYTLDAVLKQVTSKIRGGENFNYGPGTARAQGAKKFSSLEQLAGHRNRIVPKHEFEKAKNEWQESFDNLMSETGLNSDTVLNAIGESYKKGRYLSSELRQDGIVLPPDQHAKLAQLAQKLVKLPSEYFEAKPQRAVGLHEFKGAAVPTTAKEETVKRLKSLGLHVEIYDEKNPNSRRDAINRIASAQKLHLSENDSLSGLELASGSIQLQPEDFDDENWMDFDAPHESTENLSKSIKAIPRGRKVASTHLGPIHSYSHVLSPDHIKQGYRMTVRTADFGEGSGGQEGISANLYHGKKEIGSVTGSLHHDTKTAQIKFSALDQEHRGKGLGLLAYESLLAHAHHIGIEKVRGHEHSTAASALHSALAQKHGLDYKPEPAANHSRVKPDDFDARFGPYEYMIKAEDLQPFIDGMQDPDQILRSNPSAETLDALANSSIESVSTKAKLVRGLESDVKDLLLLSPVSLPWEYATYQTRHLFLDTALPLLPRHLWNQARQAMNQTPPLNQASAHEPDLAPTDDELLQWVVQSEPVAKSFRHALMGLAAASVLAHPGQIHRDAKVTQVSKLADPNLSVEAVNPKSIKAADQKVGGGMTSERGATMHIPGKFDPANRWTMRDLPIELKALSFAETSGGLKWGHDKHSRGEFDTAYGPVGLKPSSAYENFKNSKVLAQAYPHIVTSTDFLNEFQQNPKFYNTLASKEWSRMLKDSKGNPEEAAARWRLGSGAISQHIAAGIHPTPVIQDYISKFRAGMAKLHPKTTENTVHVASSPKVTNE